VDSAYRFIRRISDKEKVSCFLPTYGVGGQKKTFKFPTYGGGGKLPTLIKAVAALLTVELSRQKKQLDFSVRSS
jgi:hypothetical protein